MWREGCLFSVHLSVPQGQGFAAGPRPSYQAPAVVDGFCFLYPCALTGWAYSLGWNELAFWKRLPKKIFTTKVNTLSEMPMKALKMTAWKKFTGIQGSKQVRYSSSMRPSIRAISSCSFCMVYKHILDTERDGQV